MGIARDIETYLLEGCGRCPLGGTTQCKVHTWKKELELLRSIVLECGFAEEMKWGVPCYTIDNKNVAMIAAFKDHCVLSFFKGVLIQDQENILELPGEHTQSGRIVKFRDTHRISELAPLLRAYLFEAIEIERAGLKPEFNSKSKLVYPEELIKRFMTDSFLEAAFEKLTPGRQRGYILYFNGAKQSSTREARIEKCAGKILNGEGLHDR